MSDITSEVINLLFRVKGVNFKVGTFEFADYMYYEIARDLRNENIYVVGSSQLNVDTPAAYHPGRNWMYYRVADEYKCDPKDLWVASSFVHEATHAINDRKRRSTMSKIDNEATAYIAQWLYLSWQTKMPDYYFKKGPFGELGTALNNFKLLSAMIDFFQPGKTLDLTDSTIITELRRILGSTTELYQEFVGQMATDNDGLPMRCRFVKHDKPGKKIHLTITTGIARTSPSEKIFKYTATTRVIDGSGNAIAGGFGDARFKVGADLTISCEGAATDEVVWARLN